MQIYKRYNVDGSDDVTTHKAIRCANDKIVWCFDIFEPTSDLLQNDLQRKSSLIIITDINMMSKRVFLKKVTFFSSPVQSTGRAIVVTLSSALPLPLPFPSRHF